MEKTWCVLVPCSNFYAAKDVAAEIRKVCQPNTVRPRVRRFAKDWLDATKHSEDDIWNENVEKAQDGEVKMDYIGNRFYLARLNNNVQNNMLIIDSAATRDDLVHIIHKRLRGPGEFLILQVINAYKVNGERRTEPNFDTTSPMTFEVL